MSTETSAVEAAAQRTASHLDSLTTAAGGTAGAFVAGIPSIKQAVSAISGLIPFGDTMTKVSGYLEGQIDVYRQLTRSGVNFGGQLDRIQIAATDAGLSIDQLKSVIKENSELFASLGRTANEGAEGFMASLASFRTAIDDQSAQGLRYSTQLRRLGMDFEDFAEQMAIVEQFQVMSARRTFMTDEQRNRATFEFSKELDILSKLTGKQNDELKKEMAARMREGDYQAFLAGLDPEESKKVMLAQAKAEAAGFGDLFKDYMIRGFPSEDQRMLAGMSGDMVSLFSNMRGSLQSGDMSAFDNYTSEIMVTGAATQMANREIAMLGNTTRSATAMMNSFANSSPVMAKFRQLLQQEADARGINIRDIDRATRNRIMAEAEAAAEAEQNQQRNNAVDGDSKAILDALLLGQEKLVDVAAETQRLAVAELYQMLGREVQPFITELNNLNVEGLASQLAGDMRAFMFGSRGGGSTSGPTPNISSDAFNNFMADLGGRSATDQGVPADYARRISELRRRVESADADEKQELQAQLDSLITEAADKFNLTNPLSAGSGTPSDSEITISTSGDVIVNGNVTPAYNGTLGAFGNVLNDFGRGTLMELHNREAILNEEQLNNLVAGTMQMGQSMRPAIEQGTRSSIQGLQGMLNNIRPQMQNMANETAPQMEQLADQMAPILREMTENMRGPMEDMRDSLRGPMESLAGNAQRSLGVLNRQLRVQRMIPGNIFGGL